MAFMNLNTNGITKLSTKDTKELRDRLAFYEGLNYWAHQKDCKENRDYRFGKQWLDTEIIAREANGKETLTLNRMRKILNGMVGLKTANKPKYNVIPHSGDDAVLSSLYGQLLDTSFYNSNGMDTLRNVVMYGDGDNIGYFHVKLNTKGLPVFEGLDYSQVVVDPNSEDSLFRDAEYIYIKRWIPIERAKVLYGITDFDTGMPDGWTNKTYINSRTGSTDDVSVERMVDTSKRNVKIYEGYHKYIEAYNGGIRTRIKKEVIVGYNYIHCTVLPESIIDFPIIPYYVDFVNNPYRVGEGHYLKEVNDFINSSINITMEGARRNSNPETFLTEDMVDGDMKAWRSQYGAGERYFMIKKDRGGATPYTVAGQPLNQAWFGLLNFFMSEQEFMTMPNQMLGFNDATERERKDMIGKREAVLDSMKLALGHLDSAISQVGRVTIQYYRAYVPKDRVLYIANGDEKIKRYSILSRAGLNLDDQDSVNRYKKHRLEMGDNPNQVETDLSNARADKAFYVSLQDMYNPLMDDNIDVHVVAMSYSSSYLLQQFDRLMAMKQAGLHIDDEDIIKRSPIEDAERIAERASMNRSLMSENEQFRHLVEELKARISQLEGIVSQGKMAGIEQEHTYKAKKQLDDIKNKGYVRKKIEGLQSHQIIKEERMKANHEIELLKAKLSVLETEAIKEAKDSKDEAPETLGDILL